MFVQGIGDVVVQLQRAVHPGGRESVRVGDALGRLVPGRFCVQTEQKFLRAACVRQPLVSGGRRAQFQPLAATQGLRHLADRPSDHLSRRIHVLRFWTPRDTVN